RSCSFISRMRVVLGGYGPALFKMARRNGRSVGGAGLESGFRQELCGPDPDATAGPNTRDRDSTASAYVRWDAINIRKRRQICKGGHEAVFSGEWVGTWLNL